MQREFVTDSFDIPDIFRLRIYDIISGHLAAKCPCYLTDRQDRRTDSSEHLMRHPMWRGVTNSSHSHFDVISAAAAAAAADDDDDVGTPPLQ